MEILKTYIRNIVSIGEEELTGIAAAFYRKAIKKHTFLLKAGQFCDACYFVESGALRISTTIDEKAATSWFAFENFFFTETESYVNSCRSRFSIQAIEESVICSISRKNMDGFLRKSLQWNQFIRKNQEQAFIKLQEVVLSFQMQTATDRYENLFNHPAYLHKTRQKDLASMLGVTPSSLSRLRGKK